MSLIKKFLILCFAIFPIYAIAETVWSTGAYKDNEYRISYLEIPGATKLTVSVSGEIEANYDFISIFNQNEQKIKSFSGRINESFSVDGSKIKILFSSDSSITKSGITISIAGAGSSTGSSGGARTNSPVEKLVIVNGMDVSVAGTCYYDSCPNIGYMRNSDRGELQESLFLLDGLIPQSNIHEFKWSADPISHHEHGTNLKTKFKEWFEETVCPLQNVTCNVSIIAHSWGGLIAADYIASMSETTNTKIRTVVTYGSTMTGAQIGLLRDPFWEIARDKISLSNGVWINVINTKDILAWSIPGVINLQPDGTASNKSRMSETFPVSNSEIDYAYSITSMARQCGYNFIPGNCILIGSANFANYWYQSGNGALLTNLNDWINYIFNTHLTRFYEPNRLVAHIACKGFNQHCDISAPAAQFSPVVTENSRIQYFYNLYPGYFGTKSGANYSCFAEFICQNFVNGTKIAVHINTQGLFYFNTQNWYGPY